MEDWKSRKQQIQKATPLRGQPFLFLIYAGALDSIEAGRRFDLVGDELIIGRSSDADIQVDRDAISRRHARLQRVDGGWMVTDLQSTNGSYVNDEPVRERRLADGDLLKVGNAIFKYIASATPELSLLDEQYRVAVSDGLTSVHSRRSFLETLAQEVARAQHHKRHLTVVLVDIEQLKAINDTHGQITGDQVIIEVARRIRARLLPGELISRYDGGLFGLILPECDASRAQDRADDLALEVERDTVLFEGEHIRAHVTVGLATLGPEPDAAALIRAAYESLGRSKQKRSPKKNPG